MNRQPKLLAAASGGGHWIELMRLRPAFAGWEVSYVSMFENYQQAVAGSRFYTVPDASRFDMTAFPRIFIRAFKILLAERPHAVITTGSAPMLAFVILGRLMGIQTLWIDSIAQNEHLSASGRVAKRLAHRAVTQWPEVGTKEGVQCWGRVL